MLTVEQIDEYLRVAGYEDGSDWWTLLPHRRPEFSYGVAGPAHVWYGERGGPLHILHAPSRRRLATVQLEGYSPTGLRGLPVTASRDYRWSAHRPGSHVVPLPPDERVQHVEQAGIE